MKNNIINIFLSAFASAKRCNIALSKLLPFSAGISLVLCCALSLTLTSCELEESTNNSNGYIEFVARPTSYNLYNVGTRAASSEIAAWENNIYTAFFMVFDNNGNRVIYRDVTPTSGNTIASQILQADKAMTSTKICYLINVPTAFATALTTWSSLNSTPLPIEYASVNATGCIGVPILRDAAKQSIPEAGVHALPMFGHVENCNLSGVTTQYQTNPITLNRLFSKVDVKLNVTNDIRFDLTNYTVGNIPNKVKLLPSSEGNPSAFATSQIASDFLTSENTMTSYNLIDSQTGNFTTGFFFYVPEHILGGTITKDGVDNSIESNKPLLVKETNYKPTFVEINGDLTKETAEYTGKYTIYLGKNEKNDFDLVRNTYYKNTVTIKGITAENRVELLGGDEFINLVDGEAANCYVITTAGKYILPAYRGATKSLSTADVLYGKPRIVWSELDDDAIEFKNSDKNDSKIVFEIKAGKHKAGNALIAIVDDKGTPQEEEDDEILWSWHLWCCTDNPENKLQSYSVSDKTYQMMNRNLGATNSIGVDLSSIGGSNNSFYWNEGLYYQWGRKDPMRKGGYTKNTSSSVQYTSTVQNPTVFYTTWTANDAGWANDKEADDPCPPGYKMPPTTIWAKEKDNINRTINMNSAVFIYDFESLNLKMYPYSGEIDSEGEYVSGDQGKGVESGTYTILNLTPPQFPISTEHFNSEPSYDPKQYRNIDYNHYDEEKLGNLWGNDSKYLTFGYETKGAKITGYDYRKGSWKKGGLFTKYYYASYNIDPRTGWTNDVSNSDQPLPDDHYNSLIEDYILPLLNLQNIGSYFTDEKIYDKPESSSLSRGLQVRCMKDTPNQQ